MPDFEDVKRLALALPDVEESTSYHTPALKVRGKLMARLREDGLTLAIRATFQSREGLPLLDPVSFSIPAHYLKSDMVVIHLPTVRVEHLRDLLHDAWVLAAPAAVRKAHPHLTLP